MKKSLIALAVLAASGAAFAQSTVTLYGKADVFFGSIKGSDNVRKNVLNSGGAAASRWGIKGSEDLGSGLKANFLLEQGFNIDNGTGTQDAGQPFKAFSRQAYVGFSGGFGEVKLGSVNTAYDDVSGSSEAVFGSKLSPMGNVFISDDYTGNPGNTLYYASPSFNGFTGAFSYSLGENKTATNSASSIASLGLSYENGPVAAQFGFQREKPTGSGVSTKFTRLGGSYDFGVAVAKLTYGRVSNDVIKTTEYQIGADFPVSEVLTLSASYAKSKDKINGVDGSKRKGYGLGAKYDLSKRTFVYGGYEADTTKIGNNDSKARAFAIGVNHSF